VLNLSSFLCERAYFLLIFSLDFVPQSQLAISLHASLVVGQIQSSPGPGFNFRCRCFSLFIDFCGTSSFLSFGISFREQLWNLARRHHARFVSGVRFLFVFSVRAHLALSPLLIFLPSGFTAAVLLIYSSRSVFLSRGS
jgi:hypothetical protein